MLPLARCSLRLVRAFRHQIPQHITGHTSPMDEECRTSSAQYTPAPSKPRVACDSERQVLPMARSILSSVPIVMVSLMVSLVHDHDPLCATA